MLIQEHRKPCVACSTSNPEPCRSITRPATRVKALAGARIAIKGTVRTTMHVRSVTCRAQGGAPCVGVELIKINLNMEEVNKVLIIAWAMGVARNAMGQGAWSLK